MSELVELVQKMVFDRTGLILKAENNGQELFLEIINIPNIGEDGYETSIDRKGIFIQAKNQMVLPQWHRNARGGIWVFIDEIIVE